MKSLHREESTRAQLLKKGGGKRRGAGSNGIQKGGKGSKRERGILARISRKMKNKCRVLKHRRKRGGEWVPGGKGHRVRTGSLPCKKRTEEKKIASGSRIKKGGQETSGARGFLDEYLQTAFQ